MSEKNIVTLSMLWIGALVLVAETDWLVNARKFIEGKASGATAGK